MRTIIAAALIALSLSIFFACHKRDPVRQTLDAIVAEVEDRDADGVAKLLSDSFNGQGGESRQESLEELRKYLFAYQNIDVQLTDVTVDARENAGSSDFVAVVSGNPKTIGGLDQILPRFSRVRFHVGLRKESAGWRVTAASWERLE